jgi:PmbA protein
MPMDAELARLAEHTLEAARAAGAAEVAVTISRVRFFVAKQRLGKIELLESSTSRGMSLELYADGRYSANSTSSFDAEELRGFVRECFAMTRLLAPDPHRGLADPSLYGPTRGVELDLVDPAVEALEVERRLSMLAAVEEGVAAAGGGGTVVSSTAELRTSARDTLQIHSNGFRGEHAGTSVSFGAEVTVREEGDRRPEDHCFVASRHLSDLPDPRTVGKEAAARALSRLGGAKAESRRMPLLVENRAAMRLVGSLLEPLTGASLQQRRSCFEGRLGDTIGSRALTLVDQPLIPRGLGSRTFDGDGLAARELPVIVEGRLESPFVDVYYGRKLGVAPTTASTSNLVLPPGARGLEELLAGLDEAILVTSFLGGNSNPATGDFSFGIVGDLVRHGKRERPVCEMNITGSHLSLWERLVSVGADPYRQGPWRIPSLLFDGVQFSGA